MRTISLMLCALLVTVGICFIFDGKDAGIFPLVIGALSACCILPDSFKQSVHYKMNQLEKKQRKSKWLRQVDESTGTEWDLG